MGLILTRSPFHISRGELDANASLTVQIGRSDSNSLEILETYNLNFRNNFFIDISNLCATAYEYRYLYIGGLGKYVTPNAALWGDYGIVTVTLTGNINGVAQGSVETVHICADGYVYSSELMGKDFASELESNNFYAGSSDIVYKLNGSGIRVPLLNPNIYESQQSVYISFLNNNTVLSTLTTGFQYADQTTSAIQLVNAFYETGDVDQIKISYDGTIKTISVKTIEECKYNPYRITFKNRYGAMEDLWFFKKSTESISVKSDDFRANQFKLRSSQSLNSLGVIRSNQEYNKNGTTSITLNSGFVDEALNESFKQLMLSEDVELYDSENDLTSAVKIKDSELKLKTSTNDKLINYTIEVEFSNNIIDNIV